MIKGLISKIIIILFVVGGAVAGDMLKPSANGASAEEHGVSDKKDKHEKPSKKDKGYDKKKSSGGDGHGKKKAKGDGKSKKGKKDKHGKDKGHGEASSGAISYFKFSRQFIVPVMEQKRVRSLVILDLNLELDPGVVDKAYSMEPKLRDAITRSLLELSSNAAFKTQLTNPKTFNLLRDTVHDAANVVLEEGVMDVLIIDMIQQDQ